MEFMFGIPRFVQFGSGVGTRVGEVARSFGAQKVLFVYDQGVKAAGLVDNVLTSLREVGLEVMEFGEVLANPTDKSIEEASAAVVDAIKRLSWELEIPTIFNPREASKEDVLAILEQAY